MKGIVSHPVTARMRRIVGFCAMATLSGGVCVRAAATEPPPYRAEVVDVARDAPYLRPDGAVRIVGTEVATEMIEALDRGFTRFHPGVRFAPQFKGTTAAIPALTYGVSALAPMGRRVTWVEKIPYAKVVGGEPLEFRLAHGALTDRKKANVLAVFVNKANPIEHLTTGQLAQVFGTGSPKGDITVWGQAGVTGDLAKQPIHAYGARDDGGFGQFMLTTHLQGLRFRRGYERLGESGEIVKRVGDDAGGVGYAAISFLTPAVKIVALASNDGGPYSSGAEADLAAGTYPMDRFLYVYARRAPGQPLDPVVREYLRFVYSQEGQAIIADPSSGYVPLNAQEVAIERSKLE